MWVYYSSIYHAFYWAFMFVCFCCFYDASLLQLCLQASIPFQDNTSWWCELRPIKHLKVLSVNLKLFQLKKALRATHREDCLFQFNTRYAKLPKYKKTAFLPSNHPVSRSRATHVFSWQDERTCNWSTLILPHVKKLLLTWHFLTREGYSRGEKRGREKVKQEGIPKRCRTMMAQGVL